MRGAVREWEGWGRQVTEGRRLKTQTSVCKSQTDRRRDREADRQNTLSMTSGATSIIR